MAEPTDYLRAWRFAEGDGDTVSDAAGSGDTLVITGTGGQWVTATGFPGYADIGYAFSRAGDGAASGPLTGGDLLAGGVEYTLAVLASLAADAATVDGLLAIASAGQSVGDGFYLAPRSDGNLYAGHSTGDLFEGEVAAAIGAIAGDGLPHWWVVTCADAGGGNATVTLYLDGVQVAQATKPASLAATQISRFTVANQPNTSVVPVAYGPRVTPGVAGAAADALGGPGVVLLDAGTYPDFVVPANTLVKPNDGAAVTLSGQTSFGANSGIYGVTLDPAAAQWAARIQADNVRIEHCDFIGTAGTEHIRAERAGVQIRANTFAGSSTNHTIKVDGRNLLTGGGTIADNLFAGAPGEDFVQCEGQTATVIEQNEFSDAGGGAAEDCIDIKSGEQVTVRGHDFVGSAMSGEALLFQNGTAPSIAERNRFASTCFCSFGANLEPVAGSISDCVFSVGSTLRLRRSFDVECRDLEMTAATVRLGTSTTGDFPTNAIFRDNAFTNLTIEIGNANSTTQTIGNTYAGTTTGSFPSGNT